MRRALNFHPSEKDRLNKEFFIHLADEYMNKVGFGGQPYLVYQHKDAGHPHVHVLSTLIKGDGKRISTHFIAKNIIPAGLRMQVNVQVNGIHFYNICGITPVDDGCYDRYVHTSSRLKMCRKTVKETVKELVGIRVN
ncbi:MAG: relaxase/mobilization nuclease domain-containing protein [Agriterribacter sp.]